MKNILLATTALVMSAGFASAEVTFSGSASAGIMNDGGAAAPGELRGNRAYNGIDINISATTTTDSGMTVTFADDNGGGSMLDLLDDFAVEDQGTTIGTPTLTVVASGVTVKLDNAAIGNFYDGDGDDGDISVTGAMGDVSWGITTEVKADAGAVLNSYKLGYTLAGVALSAAGTDDDQLSVSASMVLGAATITVTSDKNEGTVATTAGTNGTVVTAGIATEINGMSLSYSGGDDDSWDVAVGYTMSGLNLAYSASEAKDWTATATYALGGGATVEAGINDTDVSFIGVNLAF